MMLPYDWYIRVPVKVAPSNFYFGSLSSEHLSISKGYFNNGSQVVFFPALAISEQGECVWLCVRIMTERKEYRTYLSGPISLRNEMKIKWGSLRKQLAANLHTVIAICIYPMHEMKP